MSVTETIKEMFTGSPDVTGLKGLFIEGLKDIYYAEKHLLGVLDKMSDSSASSKLSKAFAEHRTETEGQITRLETIFRMLDMSPSTKECEAIEGLTAEGDDVIDETDSGAVRDAGLIYAAQGVEHYEIGRYGTLCAWAKQLGLTEAARLLAQTLKEEEAANMKLNTLAEGGINAAAITGEDLDDDADLPASHGARKRGSSSHRSHA